MGVVDAPQWLLPAYVRSVKAVGATASVGQIHDAGERLVSMWISSDRHFHNLKHAIDMLARVDELADESHNPDVMRLAVWYHGCVFSASATQTYQRNGGEDEVASAAYAAQDLSQLGVPDAVTDRICALILHLKRHDLDPSDIDALALNDADLGTLAVGPQQYRRYRELVREEYAHIPAQDYLTARLTIISKLLARDSLFSSPMGARWELAARENLEAERRLLRDELAALTSADQPPASGAEAALAHLSAQVEQAAAEGTRIAAEQNAARPGETDAAEEIPATPVTLKDASDSDSGSSVTSSASQPVAPMPAPAVSSLLADLPSHDPHSHTTSMESCAEDLDRLMSSRRVSPDAPTREPLGSGGSGSSTSAAGDRQSMAEAARLKLAEKLRAKVEEAKLLREARTGELQPITEEIVDDGAADL